MSCYLVYIRKYIYSVTARRYIYFFFFRKKIYIPSTNYINISYTACVRVRGRARVREARAVFDLRNFDFWEM